MSIIIKQMETKDEIKEKAYVHWCAWHEAYPDLVNQEYLNKVKIRRLFYASC